VEDCVKKTDGVNQVNMLKLFNGTEVKTLRLRFTVNK